MKSPQYISIIIVLLLVILALLFLASYPVPSEWKAGKPSTDSWYVVYWGKSDNILDQFQIVYYGESTWFTFTNAERRIKYWCNIPNLPEE